MQKDNPELRRNLAPFFVRRGDPIIITNISNNNVNNPPTAANLNAAFDTPANLPEGFTALVNDNGAGTAVWIVVALDGLWFYELLTVAV